ncbi:MAG: SDR family NAD(P)-dependent oxidoreductase, partial [Bradyrhizobium sp.]|uniref:SDR family NAD(P)-dependent oxidoreductase n=1 Tax=Bradyrhizobium sp. TaxID=376 RepID=UPI00273110B1
MPDAIRLPSFRLDDRVAMVTGSGAGIGAGIATGLAEAGADLVLVGRTPGPLEATARRVESLGRKATIVVCDLTDRTGLRRHIASLQYLDILVNNAGTSIPEPILDVADASL